MLDKNLESKAVEVRLCNSTVVDIAESATCLKGGLAIAAYSRERKRETAIHPEEREYLVDVSQ